MRKKRDGVGVVGVAGAALSTFYVLITRLDLNIQVLFN